MAFRFREELAGVATDERKAIGSRIRKALDRADVRPSDLARELHKVDSAVSGWLSGRTQPSLELLAYICRRTKTSADELLGLAAPSSVPHEVIERAARELDRQASEAEKVVERAKAAAARLRDASPRKR
jgi:transcriptional regulator with XRE-family HTH domain